MAELTSCRLRDTSIRGRNEKGELVANAYAGSPTLQVVDGQWVYHRYVYRKARLHTLGCWPIDAAVAWWAKRMGVGILLTVLENRPAGWDRRTDTDVIIGRWYTVPQTVIDRGFFVVNDGNRPRYFLPEQFLAAWPYGRFRDIPKIEGGPIPDLAKEPIPDTRTPLDWHTEVADRVPAAAPYEEVYAWVYMGGTLGDYVRDAPPPAAAPTPAAPKEPKLSREQQRAKSLEAAGQQQLAPEGVAALSSKDYKAYMAGLLSGKVAHRGVTEDQGQVAEDGRRVHRKRRDCQDVQTLPRTARLERGAAVTVLDPYGRAFPGRMVDDRVGDCWVSPDVWPQLDAMPDLRLHLRGDVVRPHDPLADAPTRSANRVAWTCRGRGCRLAGREGTLAGDTCPACGGEVRWLPALDRFDPDVAQLQQAPADQGAQEDADE